MGSILRELQQNELQQLHHMMVERGFPNVPTDFLQADEALEETLNYGLFTAQGQLEAGFIFGDITEDSAFFDVVCSAKYQGRWATKKSLKALYNVAFSQLGLDFIWVQPHNPEALKAALQAGFVFATSSSKKSPVLVLTARHIRHKFNKIDYIN